LSKGSSYRNLKLVTPYFFNSHGKQLFAIYHQANPESLMRHAVILCYPIWQEYMRAHWAFRMLAEALAKNGFDVLRFDYRGTGDSEGDELEFKISDWINDIQAASEEAKAVAAVSKISAIGMRFGASLAVLASQRGVKLEKLALWDPIIKGSEYLYLLKDLNHKKAEIRYLRGGPAPSLLLTDEILGYRASLSVQEEIKNINLNQLDSPNAKQVAVFLSEGEVNYKYATCVAEITPPGLWNELSYSEQALLPALTIETIVSFMAEANGK
jgi:alpha/beta superfamily hydrolase